MKKPLGAVLGFIIVWVFLTLVLVVFIQSRGENPVVRMRQEVVEAFQIKMATFVLLVLMP